MLMTIGLACLCVAVLMLASQSMGTAVGRTLFVLGLVALICFVASALRVHGYS